MTTWEKWAEWVNQQLQGHQRKLERIEKEIEALIEKVKPLYLARLESKLYMLLCDEEKPRSWSWLRNRLGHDAWDSLQSLLAQGRVTIVKSTGRTMYVAREDDA